MSKLISFFLLLFFLSQNVHSEKLVVTTSTDSKDNPLEGMLRYWILNASSGDTITFESSITSIVLDTTLRINGGKLTIDGENRVTIDCAANGTVFNISSYTYDDITIKGLTIQGGAITGAFAWGAGMYAYARFGQLLVKNCIFKNNTVSSDGDGQGGGLRTDGGTFEGCIFAGNKVNGTGYALGGGGIFAIGAKFINCLVTNNQAEYGGGVYASGSEFINCTIADNNVTVADNGGGVSSESGSTFTNCIIYRNEDNTGTDNVDQSGSSFSFCAFEAGNTLVGTNDNIGLLMSPFDELGVNSFALIEGSSCINIGTASGITVPDYDITGNDRVIGTKIDLGAYEFESRSPILVWRSDDGINSEMKIGMLRYAIYNANNGDTVRFAVDSVAIDPSVASSFDIYEKSIVIDGSDMGKVVIDGNDCSLIFIVNTSAEDTVIFKNLIIQNGNGYTGGLSCKTNYDNDSLIVENCIFRNNRGVEGGAITAIHGYFANCAFNNNVASGINSTGGVDLQNGYIKNCVFDGNEVDIVDMGMGIGGASARNSAIDSCEFINNFGIVAGGLNAVGSQITHCKFIKNYASGSEAAGGALSNDYSLFENCLFSENFVQDESNQGVGGLYNALGLVRACTFEKNRGTTTVEENYFPAQGGGGAFTYGGTFINCLFAENEALNGAGLWCYHGDLVKIINCTFTKNRASETYQNSGGGICFNNSISEEYEVVNTVLYDNYPADLSLNNADVSFKNSASGEGIPEEGGNIQLTGTPFQNPMATDYFYLAPNSVCINSGDTIGYGYLYNDYDLLGKTRVADGTIDMGAVEYVERTVPNVTWPTTNDISYGELLEQALNDNGYANIDGAFAYDSTIIYPGAGDQKILVSFSPDDMDTYQSVYDSVDLHVDKVILSGKALNAEATYGDPEPEYQFSLTGFVLGEDISVLDIAPTVSVANYDELLPNTYYYTIRLEGGSDNNYAYYFQHGDLTINKAKLTATAMDATVAYGDEHPEFPISYSGFVKGESKTDLQMVPMTAVEGYENLDVGEYPEVIYFTEGYDNKYDFEYLLGDLTILPATLTVMAEDVSINFESEEPVYNIVYDGFVWQDDISVIDELPIAGVPGFDDLGVGTHTGAIVVEGGSDNNYQFVYQTGDLTILGPTAIEDLKAVIANPYPNPVSNILFFKPTSPDTRYVLMDASGMILESGVAGIDSWLQMNDKAAGVYILSITGPDGTHSFSILKE
jgi:hypothetical protein